MSVALSEHLPLLASAPDGIKKLRQLVLQLAIEGRITDSDKSDWTQTTLGDVGDWGSGGTPLKAHTDYYGGTIPWLVIGDLNDGLVTVAETHITEKGLANSSAKRVPVGTLLIAMYGSIGKLGIAGIECATNQAIAYCKVNSAIAECRFLFYFLRAIRSQLLSSGQGLAQQNISQKLLKATPIQLPPLAEQLRIVAKVDELIALCDRLESEQSDGESAHAQLVDSLLGTLRQSTDAEEVASNWQRIAEHFDTLLTTEGSIDALKQTVLQLAVAGKLVEQHSSDEPAAELLKRIACVAIGPSTKNSKAPKSRHPSIFENGPYTLPDGWVWTNIESISNVGTGATPSRINPAYFNPPEIPWVTSGETREPFISVTAEMVSSLALKETNLTVYPVGTLIVAMYGQGKTRGQIAELVIEAATNQACAAIVPAVSDIAMRKYIKVYFLKIYDEIREEAAGGAQPNLNVGKIKSTLISLPPLAEQHRIVAKVDELMAICDRMKDGLREARGQQSRLADTLIDAVLLTSSNAI